MDVLVGVERSDPASLFGSPRSSSQSPSPERGEQVTLCLTANTLPLHLLPDTWSILHIKSRSSLCTVAGTLVDVPSQCANSAEL